MLKLRVKTVLSNRTFKHLKKQFGISPIVPNIMAVIVAIIMKFMSRFEVSLPTLL